MAKRLLVKIEDKVKDYYLDKLDDALSVLINALRHESDTAHIATLKEISEKNNWDWNRLPKYSRISNALADQITLIQSEYRLFDWITNRDPDNNMGYFERLDITPDSGLPSVFDHLNLKNIKGSAEQLMEKIPGYDDLYKQYSNLIMTDITEIKEVKNQAESIKKQAMRRNFLEYILKKDLIGTGKELECMMPQVIKVRYEHFETLWTINFMKYSMSSGVYQLYSIDLWQDNADPQIIEQNGIPVLSETLKKTLNSFGTKNDTYFILKSIDDSFESIHPVHVTRGILGPFESKYMDNNDYFKKLQITKEILNDDENFTLLRFNRQYSYAPNHIAVGEGVRQKIDRESWSNETIVCPAMYQARVARSLLGTDLQVLGM